ncbi:MAG: FAD-dependent oxidoreductase [Chloroflexota bacterium]
MSVPGGNGRHAAADNLAHDLIVIGGGPAGATAAMYAPRAEIQTLVLDKGLTAGALGFTARIIDYPGILGEINDPELLDRIRRQAEAYGARFVQDKVQAVDLVGDHKTVYANYGTHTARTAIIAGAQRARATRAREDQLTGRGVSHCATCDAAFFFRDQEVALVGNDDEAIEETLFLAKFAGQIHPVSPTPELNASPRVADSITAQPKVTIHPAASLGR